jgi:diguanylate cyclase
MIATHNIHLVLLSIIIAVISSYAALDLAGRVTVAQGRARQLWLVGGAIAMGTGIWSMHFIAMLAYKLPIPIDYNYWIVFVSMVVAIFSSGLALFIVSRPQVERLRFLIGGSFMGLGIASMHYLGMAAIQIEAKIEYDWLRVALSLGIAIVASLTALWLAFYLRSETTVTGIWRKKMGSALVMGTAIAGMHYTAMTAVCVRHTTGQPLAGPISSSNQTELAVAIGIVTLGILALALQAAFVDRRFNLEAQLTYLANHDALTGLYNRRHFCQQLEHHLVLAERHDRCGALLFIDLDDFKDINDTLGHQIGDELLKNLVALLQTQLRQSDILARLGGDEFAIILPQITAVDLLLMTQRLLKALEETVFTCSEHPVRITASIGAIQFSSAKMPVDELLACADRAMYKSKESGRNSFSFYSDDDNWRHQAESRNFWKSRLLEALTEKLFVLYCQPILDLRNHQISRYEILLRLAGKGGELILPASFLPIAESTRLIYRIDRWVVSQAIQLLALAAAAGKELQLEVNLSGKSLADSELLPMIQQELALTGVNPATLILEITETAAIADRIQAQNFIHTLKKIGCQFALDDFGIGYSSFSQLKYIPVDYLKIDGSFIKNLPHDPVDRSLVKAIVEVSQALGKSTIAEFVEDQATVDWLRQLGVDYAQGYYIGKPKPITELSDLPALAIKNCSACRMEGVENSSGLQLDQIRYGKRQDD